MMPTTLGSGPGRGRQPLDMLCDDHRCDAYLHSLRGYFNVRIRGSLYARIRAKASKSVHAA